MTYDFDTPTERRNTNSLKWDVAEGELPMWVADMDFQTAPEIREAIMKRAEHGIFGYSVIPDAWYEAYIQWWKMRHGYTMERDWLIFCTGVVPAISSIVRKLTTPAEKVLIQTPVYNIFFNSILNNGRQVLESPLRYDGKEYRIDFADLEEKLSDPQTALMILCNPHNPTGKIWDRQTLEKIGALCSRHHVTVVSDEIHCDLTDPGESYVPFASVSETCRQISITCMAPTKAFNLAGLQTAAVSVPDEVLRHKVWRALNTDEAAEPNAFAVEAAVAAFTRGADWLDALRDYLYENKKLAEAYIEKEIPDVRAVASQATYLLWLDCSGLIGCGREAAGFLRRETGLYLSEGSQYGGNGADFLRMNIACPRAVLKDGLERLKNGLAAYSVWAAEQC
ncbi:MAG TPA: pyridoxal phosphate-dependent aminotransferase [Candidatus Caccovicinus merdipullorum]|uniref:cysteine-S-conjugate beta-lyase n=1 Tax=Candidatus Caccovicinus merdipullorum TaxID=2840724 RepID=A0A9D1GKF5_9FIRM|nr:pyridoxal phosphate-dependent aminotransferase [Candidatus Caccovicinus merdipullorum]